VFYGDKTHFKTQKRIAPSVSANVITGGQWSHIGTSVFSATNPSGITFYANTGSFIMSQNRIAGGGTPVDGGIYGWEANATFSADAEL